MPILHKIIANSSKPSMPQASKELHQKTYDLDYDDLKTTHVPIDKIRATQPTINERIVHHYVKKLQAGKNIAPPELVKHKGEYGVLDGHHRIEAHIRHGSKRIKANVGY